MPIIKTIQSPHRFKERLLMFGEGGSGKSTAVLSMARYMPYAHFWVNDTDVSFAYDRLLALEFQDVDDRGNVTVLQSSDWAEFTANNEEVAAKADQANDVLVVDNGTFPWQWVQDAHAQAQYGIDIDIFLSDLRKQYGKDNKEYAKAMAEGMQWPLINKKFTKGFYKMFHSWKGHAIIVAQSKSTKGEKDDDMLTQFRIHGAMPAGQKDLAYVMATNILMMDRGKNTWAMSTTKDRGREKVAKIPVEDFAMDYLVDHGGWTVERQRV
jgi:energy-coupling factor transporter ATP-binding protein EcfA2